MKRVKLRQETQRPVTARFPIMEYAELTQEAEKLGTTVADVLRVAWKSYKEQRDVKLLIDRFESRMTRKVFEICSSTAGLSDKERKEALDEVRDRLQKMGLNHADK